MPIFTQVLGSTCSMLVRGTTPVVKAWPSMTIGASDSTGSTWSASQLAAVEHAEIGKAAVRIAAETVAEIVLSAGTEAQVLAHLRPPRVKEPDQPAVMVEVPMAEDQRVHRRRVDF